MANHSLGNFNRPTNTAPYISQDIINEQISICNQLHIPYEVKERMWYAKTEEEMHNIKLDYLLRRGRYKNM